MLKKLIFILPLIFIFSCSANNSEKESIKFNREEWLNGDIRTRGKMVDHIIKDSVLIGKTKIEILYLLGDQGDTTENFSYPVDIGLKTGPLGLGGTWVFEMTILFDTLTNKVFEVRCND